MNNYELSTKELEQLGFAHAEAKRRYIGKIADRIKAVYLLGKGFSASSISEALLMDDNTVYRAYENYQANGIEGLLETHYPGRDPELSEQELKELDETLQEQPCQTTKQVIAYVEKNFELSYSVSGMNALLKRLGYVYKKPRTIPGKYDPKAQQQFIQKYRKIRDQMTPEDSLFFMDGVHPQHNPIVQYGGFKQGSEPVLRTNTRYHRLHLQGVIDIDNHQVITQDFSRLDEDSTLDMLSLLRRRRPKGRLYLVLDNAGYYQTANVRSWAKSLGITLLFLPPYSPNLNLIERLWQFMKREVFYNHY